MYFKRFILFDKLSSLIPDEIENVSDVFPKDKITPLFQDNFNRPNQDILLDSRWMSGIGSSVFIESEHLASSGNSGNIVMTPNNPSLFPDISKTNIENSVVMEGTADQLFAILPAADMGTMTLLGCYYSYTAATKKLVVAPADSVPVLLGMSVSAEMIVDNVKAFPSFLEGRTPNGDGTFVVQINFVTLMFVLKSLTGPK